jgi:hypothetical protein
MLKMDDSMIRGNYHHFRKLPYGLYKYIMMVCSGLKVYTSYQVLVGSKPVKNFAVSSSFFHDV